MKKTIISMFLLFTLVFLAGCTGQGGSGGYSDEVLSAEIKAPTNILPNSDLEISAVLTNNVRNSISNVKFLITDTYGLDIRVIDCDRGSKLSNGCSFSRIEEDDEMEVTFILHVPESYVSTQELQVSPEFTITYDYSGQAIWSIPIVKKKSIIESIPSEQLMQTPGPIKVVVQKGLKVGSESGNELTEGSVFSLVITVSDIGGSEMTISKNNFWVKLTNLEVYGSDGQTSCSFSGSSNRLTPLEDIKLPQEDPLYCVLRAKRIQRGWDMGVVEINFNYQYKIVKKIAMNIITNLSG